jgi:hypothetical protein
VLARTKAAPMNGRRGLLRLWIIVSVLWGTISVALFWPTSEVANHAAYWHLRLFQSGLFRDAELNRAQIAKIFEAHRTLDGEDCRDYTDRSLDNLRSDENSNIMHTVTRKELGYIFCEDAKKTVNAETPHHIELAPVVQILNEGESIGAESLFFLEMALLPPLALFLIGSGLFWAIRGFRPNRRSS